MTSLTVGIICLVIVIMVSVVVALALTFIPLSAEQNADTTKTAELKKLQNKQLEKKVSSSPTKLAQAKSVEERQSSLRVKAVVKTEKKTEHPSSPGARPENIMANPYHPANPLNPLYDTTEKETEKKTAPDYDDYQSGGYFESEKVNSNLWSGSSGSSYGSSSGGYGGSSYDGGSSYGSSSSYDSSSSSSFD